MWLDMDGSIAEMLVSLPVHNRMICAGRRGEAIVVKKLTSMVTEDPLGSGGQQGGCLLVVEAERVCLLE